MDNNFQSAFGNFHLQRRPPTPSQPLQAWDAADEYLLEELARNGFSGASSSASPTLVINDQFGALALALHAVQPHSWSDSCNAHLALATNYLDNHLANNVVLIPATQPPALDRDTAQKYRGVKYRVVLWRIPKTLALFQQQAAQLLSVVDQSTLILAGGMIKHLPEQAVDIFRQLGRVDILHAQKKARLFKITPQPDLPAATSPTVKMLDIPEYALQLGAGVNVFARDKLDIGARFFIEQFDKLPTARSIADLGCGNGVLGIIAKRLQPMSEISFFDESYQAVTAAADNYRRNIGATLAPQANYYFDDCLSHYCGDPFDLILCNPPFHQNHVTGDQIAWRMFTQSKNHLRSGGEFWIVGNRHLDYPLKLKRIFGNCRQIAAHPKFVVLAAKK